MWSRGFVLGLDAAPGLSTVSHWSPPSTQAFCFAYPAFPIKRKSRKLNPKLPARYPKATRSKPTVYKSWIRFWVSEEKPKKGRKLKRCMRSVSGPSRPNSLRHGTRSTRSTLRTSHLSLWILCLSKFWLNWGILESRLILASGEYLAFCPKNMENCAAQQQGQGLQRGHY